jgi:hypothetical protein
MSDGSLLADAIRPFWLAGLNDVSGHCRKELRGWISDGQFQVYEQPSENSFNLNVSEAGPVLEAFAAEISRITVASSETMKSVAGDPPVKKSIAWLIIQTYYAAFFAAHAFMRTLGTSCIPLEPNQIRMVTKIAQLFGQEPVRPISGGLYQISFDPESRVVAATQLKSMKAGPHEAFWKLFGDRLGIISSELLTLSSVTLKSAQQSSLKLAEIRANLSFSNFSSGGWLSHIRNRVNYDQSWGTWYPYSLRHRYYDELARHIDDWQLDPLDIDVSSHDNRDLLRFQATCNAIIALSRCTSVDMSERCSGKSFHEFASLAFLRLYGKA